MTADLCVWPTGNTRVIPVVSDVVALLGTAVGTGLIVVTVGAIYLYGWKKSPEVTFKSSTPERRDIQRVPNRHGGPMYESNVPESEMESVDKDVFDPIGTATLLAVYFLVVTLTWLFMYFVEFLGSGPTVVG